MKTVYGLYRSSNDAIKKTTQVCVMCCTGEKCARVLWEKLKEKD